MTCFVIDNKLQIMEYDFISIDNPAANKSTRDIVYAKLQLNNNKIVNVFVNHWPSRWAARKTNHKRVLCTST